MTNFLPWLRGALLLTLLPVSSLLFSCDKTESDAPEPSATGEEAARLPTKGPIGPPRDTIRVPLPPTLPPTPPTSPDTIRVPLPPSPPPPAPDSTRAPR